MELEEIRTRIDALDERIIELLAQRSVLVRQAGATKQSQSAVRAPDRVEQVIGKVRAQALTVGLDPTVAEATFRAMIAAFIDMELREMRERTLPPVDDR